MSNIPTIDKHESPLHKLADSLLDFFYKENPENSISHLIQDNESGEEFVICMQKVNGISPQ